MRKVIKKGKRGNKKERLAACEEMLNQGNTSSRIELIQMLIPLGLQAIEEVTFPHFMNKLKVETFLL